ncbi:MAG: hypothetical protein HYZ18_08250 [Pseudogulbenkiania sp.]|nr:hypothetical protein [Pseudogulbenkiania sp.]
MIPIQKTVRLLLPFRPYSLKVSHRLLDSLGGVSRFLLHALEQLASLEHLAAVTGLATEVLLQQLRFLTQHGFVEMPEEGGTPALAERGTRMIAVERLLRDFDQTVWLDTFTLKRADLHLLLVPDRELLMKLPDNVDSSTETVLRLPERPWAYRPFDEVGRLRRLLDQHTLAPLLEHWWPGATALIGDEMEHWEFNLQNPDDDGSTHYMALTFEPGEFVLHPMNGAANERPSLPEFMLPVLGVKHRYSLVDGFPWQVAVPPVRTLYVERVSHGVLGDFVPSEDIDVTARVAMPITARAKSPLPAELQDFSGVPGLTTTLSVSEHQQLCHVDHVMLSQQMQRKPYFRLFSSNYLVLDEEMT